VLLSLKVSTFRSILFILFRPRFFVEFRVAQSKGFYFPEYFTYFISPPVFRRVRVAQSKGFYFPEYFTYFISPPVFRRVCVAQSKGFCVAVCLLLFVFCP
jgi:hypothetical protein